ncbi:dihydrofolate reductase [compost metagenome]
MYRAFYEQAQRIYLTMVDDVTVGDTRYFPEIKDEVWKVTSTQTVNHEDGRHSHTYINLHRR